MSKIFEGIFKHSEEALDEDLRKWFKEKWVRFNPQGKIMGPCARGSDSEGKPKCLPQKKAQSLGKKGRKYAASKKRREDPDPERKGAAKNVATKKKTNEAVEGNIKEIELKFITIELSNDNIVSYAKNYFESNNIEAPYQKFISNIKLLSNTKLTESKENAEIQEFIKALERVDSKKKIKVGDKFAVLAFEIRFAWREIDALGFTEPKEVADIKLHSDGTINYIKFTDGDRYPRLIQATRNNKPIVQAVYFDDKNKAEKALTYLTMIIPDNWEIDMNSLVRQETKKDVTEEQLDELKCWPGYTRVKGVPAGAPGSCKKKTDETVRDVLESQNKLFVKKLRSESELKEHAIKFAKNLTLDGIPVSSYNRHYTVCSTIFAANKKTITEAAHIKNGKEFVALLKRLDQFDKLNIKVGNSVAIINAQLQGDSVELWGFITPKTITKIFREPSDRSIKQFEFNNDPNDVWPRTENAEYQGHYLMYSAFFGDKKSAEHANTMLNLQASGDLSIRNHIKEQAIAEEKCPHCSGPMFSEALMMEKKDACYYKVKSRYKVWPSAYASGALVKCRKKGAKNWGTKNESAIMRGIQNEQDIEETVTNKFDITDFIPGKKVSHGLLGIVTIVKTENNSLIVKDSRGNEYKVSVTSVRNNAS